MGNGISMCGNIDVEANDKKSNENNKKPKQNIKKQSIKKTKSPSSTLKIEEYKPTEKKDHPQPKRNKPSKPRNFDPTKTRPRTMTYCPPPNKRTKKKQQPTQKGYDDSITQDNANYPSNIALFNSNKNISPIRCESPRMNKTRKKRSDIDDGFEQEFGSYLSSLNMNPNVMKKSWESIKNSDNELKSIERKTFHK